MAETLGSWSDGAAKRAIVAFVERAVAEVPVEERIATFDNDGTLWCEKPMPIQADFILRRLYAMAEADPALRERQPWKAAHERDYAWLGAVMDEHYAGDDTNVRTLAAASSPRSRGSPWTTSRPPRTRSCAASGTRRWTARYLECAYRPMVELLEYLEANGFSNYIASGGGRDFMRPVSSELYGIPRERVIGSASALDYVSDGNGGTITHKPEADYLDDGPQKPIRIWSRTGRRPLLAFGNSNGDIEMLEFTRHEDKPILPLLLLHDDAEREFDYASGSERALERAGADGWTVVSVKDDWTTVFGCRRGSRTPRRTAYGGCVTA